MIQLATGCNDPLFFYLSCYRSFKSIFKLPRADGTRNRFLYTIVRWVWFFVHISETKVKIHPDCSSFKNVDVNWMVIMDSCPLKHVSKGEHPINIRNDVTTCCLLKPLAPVFLL
jgi:hypothetical protein